MYCEQCQHDYPQHEEVCPHCTKPTTTLDPQTNGPSNMSLTCPACGKTTLHDRKFCIHCGQSLEERRKQCPNCNSAMPVEATFCGDCGTTLVLPLSSLNKSFVNKEAAPSQDSTPVGAGVNEPLPSSSQVQEVTTSWFQQLTSNPGPLLFLLVIAAGFTYWLGNSSQAPEEPTVSNTEKTPQPLPPSSQGSLEQKRQKEQPQTSAHPNQEEVVHNQQMREEAVAQSPSLPQLPVEQPLVPPRFYRVTAPTSVRDKPEQTGTAVAQLQPDTLIHVAAITGDWLKVESKATPPKPPGYVWHGDAKPEVEGEESKTSPPQTLTEQPLVPPRFYQVTRLTTVRNKPEKIGVEVAQLQPNTLIQVTAIIGDWLKVESKSTPPKPPGYVSLVDAKPDLESNTSEQAASKSSQQE